MPKAAAISVRIDAQLKRAIERAAKEDHRTVTSLIEKILTQWISEHGPPEEPARTSRRRATKAA
jgi:hypothetical protein